MYVLFATDGSQYAEAALELIVSRSWSPDVVMRVVHVLDPLQLHLASKNRVTENHSAALIHRTTTCLQSKFGSQSVSGEVISGEAKRAIVNLINKENPDLVVVGAHGNHGFGTLLLGSVTTSVIDYTRVSVLAVRPNQEAAHSSVPQNQKYLIAVDDSKFGDAVVESVGSRPWPPAAQFLLLMIHEPPTETFSESPVVDARLAMTKRQQLATRCRQIMDEKVALLQKLLPENQIIGDTLEAIEVAPAILQLAEQWEPTQIFTGSHGRNLQQMLLIGSVSRAVALHAKCSVEIIRKRSLIEASTGAQ